MCIWSLVWNLACLRMNIDVYHFTATKLLCFFSIKSLSAESSLKRNIITSTKPFLFHTVSHSNNSFQKFHYLLRSIRHAVPNSKRRHPSHSLIHTSSEHHSSHSHLDSSRHCSLRSNQILILHPRIEQSRQASLIQVAQELRRQPLHVHSTRTERKLRSHRGMKR